MPLRPAIKIPLGCRALRTALLWGLGTICAPFLRCEEIDTSSEELGFGKAAFGASDAPAATQSDPRQEPGLAPLADKPEWDYFLGTTRQPPAPYLLPIQPLGMDTAESPTLPIDPEADPTIPEPDFPESIDMNLLDLESATESGSEATDDRTPNAGDFIANLGGFSSSPEYQIPPSGMPSGFSRNPGSQADNYGLGDTFLDGLALAVFLSGTYDTNPSQGFTSPTVSGEGDFYTTLGGTVAYRSKASDWTYGALYSGSYNQYFSQNELSGYNQNAGASLNYEGGPLSAGMNVGVDFGSGANRNYAAVVDQVSVNYGLSARYRISPKTTATGNLSQSLTSASGNSSSDTGSFTAGMSALWRYSPLTEFGPGISYSQQSGSTQQDLTSIGPTLTVNYKLSSKVSLNSLVGLEFARYENGQTTDPSVSANIGLNYRASALWGMNLSFFRNVRADPGSVGQFQEITSLRLGYNRKIRRAQLNLGASIQQNTYQSPDSTVALRPDSNYLNLDSSISMPVFANSCNATIFINYSDQSGSSGADSWDSLRTGFSISRSF